MANNTLSNLAVATTAIAFSFATIEVNPARADIITYDFTVNVSGFGLPENTYSGFFQFDDDFPVMNVGCCVYLGYELTNFEFDFIGLDSSELLTPRRYTLEDLDETPYWVVENARGGVEPQLDATYTEENLRFRFGEIERAIGFSAQLGANINFETLNAVEYTLREEPEPPTSVPEPSLAIGVAVLGLGFLFLKKDS